MIDNIKPIACIVALAITFGSTAIKEDYKIERVDERCTLGEGPYWDDGHQLLYWVDMKHNAINSYDPETKVLHKATIESDKTPVTLVVRVKDTKDKFVVALKGSLAVVQWDGRSTKKVTAKEFADIEDPKGSSRCNDGKVDPANRLWVGTMGAQLSSNPNTFEKDKGGLFLIGPDGSKHEKVKHMQIANGLDWSLDLKKFYLVDSLTYIVYEFDYKNDDGTIENQKDLYNLKEAGLIKKMNSLPDGMTIDSEGYLWVAVYGVGKVIRIDPKTRQKVFEIDIPKVLQPTSVCFGGKNLDILFVTSARVDWSDKLESEYPESGYLFKITGLGVKGKPSRPVKLDESILKE